MFKYNPEERWSAQQCMSHSFFRNVAPVYKTMASSQGTQNANNRIKRPRF